MKIRRLIESLERLEEGKKSKVLKQAEKLAWKLRDMGYTSTVIPYSGRGMFGKGTWAVGTDLRNMDTVKKIAKSMSGWGYDQFGMGMVFYTRAERETGDVVDPELSDEEEDDDEMEEEKGLSVKDAGEKLVKYLDGLECGEWIRLTDITYKQIPIHFEKLLDLAGSLAKKGIISMKNGGSGNGVMLSKGCTSGK